MEKSAVLRFLGLALGILLLFGVKVFITYLSNCCVTSTGALVLICIGIVVGIILTSITLDKCLNYILCQDRKGQDEANDNYLFGYV